MKEEIMNNFYAKMDEFKEREWYDDAIKSARYEKLLEWKLRKIDKERDKIQEALDQARIAHRWETEVQNAPEKVKIPPKLKAFREKWEKNIGLPEDKKKAIIEAVNRIQKGAKEESDWSISVTFELWWKRYKSLNVNLSKENSDKKYLKSFKYQWREKEEVELEWMMWDDTSNWKNKKLAKYIDKQKKDGLKIPTIELRRELLSKLWEEAGLTEESDQIAMWMYLTWSYWWYWWTMWDDEKSNIKADSRSLLTCDDDSRDFDCSGSAYDDPASLCLIGCK